MSTSSRLSSVSSRSDARRVDWDEVRARLERSAQALAAGDENQIADELQRRARRIAAAPAWVADPGAAERETIDALAFRIGSQLCAVDSSHVREAVQLMQLTPLPGLPATLRGLANVRSQIVPAFDLRSLLQLPAAEAGPTQPTLLILAFNGAEFGICVDALEGSLRLPQAALRTDLPALQMQYLQGVTADGTVLLDLASLVAALTPGGKPA